MLQMENSPANEDGSDPAARPLVPVDLITNLLAQVPGSTRLFVELEDDDNFRGITVYRGDHDPRSSFWIPQRVVG